MLRINAVIGNPPYNIQRELVSYKFIYKCLKNLDPDYLQFIIPVSTGDPRLGSQNIEYQYVRERFYGSPHISRTIDFYRGYLAFVDKTNVDLGCIDGGVEAIVYEKKHKGKCLTTFFSNHKEKCSFNSYYYWFPEIRLRHKTDIRIIHHMYPTLEVYQNTPLFSDYVKQEMQEYDQRPNDWYVITVSGAALHYLHEVYGSKKYNLDVRACLKSDYIPPKDSDGMGIHRRLVCTVPASRVKPLVSFLSSKLFSYLTWILQTGRHVDYHNWRLVPTDLITNVNYAKVWCDTEIFRSLNFSQEFVTHVVEETKIMPIPRTSVIAPFEFLGIDILSGVHSQFN